MSDPETYIYIFARSSGATFLAPVKIGISVWPESRLRRARTFSPYPLALFAELMLLTRSDAFALEQAVHARLSPYRLNGEWFEIEPIFALDILTREVPDILRKSRPDEFEDYFHLVGSDRVRRLHDLQVLS